jgi:hypothetical protein
MSGPTLIYCADGNQRFAEIAIQAGYEYGAQLPNTVYFPVYFADQDWKNPDRKRYMAALAEYKPSLASVLDWESPEQLDEVLSWAEEAAQYVETVMIIPKVMGGIPRIPRSIGGKPVRLGYSVPTKFGGTSLPVWEFHGWPVHLLGGSPRVQMRLTHYLNVVSVDGNFALKMATRNCQFFDHTGTSRHAKNRYWPTLKEAHGAMWDGGDAPYEAFERSCKNIMKAWRRLEMKNTQNPSSVRAVPPEKSQTGPLDPVGEGG